MQVLIYKNICSVEQPTYKTSTEKKIWKGGVVVTILGFDTETITLLIP